MSEEPLIANVYLDFANFIMGFGPSLRDYGLIVSVGNVNYLGFKQGLEKKLSEQFQTEVVIRSFRIYFAVPRNDTKHESTLLMVGQTVAEIAEDGITLVEGFYNNADIWCPNCRETHKAQREKCVDTAIVAHIVEDACSQSVDELTRDTKTLHRIEDANRELVSVYVLCSGDADFEPALRVVVNRGFKAVVASWGGQSIGLLGRLNDVRRLRLDDICDEIISSYFISNRSGNQVVMPTFAFREYFQIKAYLSACTLLEHRTIAVYQGYRHNKEMNEFNRAIAWLRYMNMITVDAGTGVISV